MASGNVSHLATALEIPSKNIGVADISIQSQSIRGTKIGKTGLFNNAVMTVSDRVQRQRASFSNKSLEPHARKNNDLTFLERKPMPKKGSAGTVTTSQTLTSSGSISNPTIGDIRRKVVLQVKDPDNSVSHGSCESFTSLYDSDFGGGDSDSGIFADDNDIAFELRASLKNPIGMTHGQDGLYPIILVEEKDCKISRHKREEDTTTEKIKRTKKKDEVKRTTYVASSDRKEQKEKICRRRQYCADRVDEGEQSYDGVRKPKSQYTNKYQDDSTEKTLKKKPHQLSNHSNTDKKNSLAISESRRQSSSNVQRLASLIDSNNTRRLSKRNEELSTHGEKLQDKGNLAKNSNAKNRNNTLPKIPILDPDLSNIYTRNGSIREGKLGSRSEPKRMQTSHEKHTSTTSASSISSASRCEGHARSVHERTMQSSNIKDGHNRTVGSGKRRERSISRERSKEKSRDTKYDRQPLESDSARSTQPISLLESLSDLNCILGDDDAELQFSTQRPQCTLLNCPMLLSDTAYRKSSRGSQKVAQSSGVPKRTEEHGKRTPYRSKFRDQYGATGFVETGSLAPVKAAKSIFEKNRDENDLMRVSRLRSTEKKERQGRHPPALPAHQSCSHNSNDDHLSVNLASVVGNVVLEGSLHGSRQCSDVISLPPICSSQSIDKVAPSSNLLGPRSLRQIDEKNPVNFKSKSNKSLEFLEKLSLKKAKQDGCNRKFRGRIRRTKRTENIDEETCYETEDDTVKSNDGVDEVLHPVQSSSSSV